MRGLALTAMLLASGVALPGAPIGEPWRRRDDEPEPQPVSAYSSPLSVPCPRCKAKAGEGCNRKTLGRRMYHMARVQELDDKNRRAHP